MQLETKIISFIRSQRSKIFALYIRTLEELVVLYFSLNHQNYARWLSVHLHDLKTMPESIFYEFCWENFVASETQTRFSAMPYNQRHEQNNNKAEVKCKAICYFFELITKVLPHIILFFATGPGRCDCNDTRSIFTSEMACVGPTNSKVDSSFEEYYLPDADIEFRHHSEGLSF